MNVGTSGKHITPVPTFLVYNNMTAQEIFDKVAIHLLTQNAKSWASSEGWSEHMISTCSYRGDFGRMCAIGCLIPDERYTNSIEGGSVQSYQVKNILYDMSIEEHIDMLVRLQYVHDGIAVSEWRNKLRQVAKEYSLNTDCLDKDYDKTENI